MVLSVTAVEGNKWKSLMKCVEREFDAMSLHLFIIYF